MKNLIFAFLFIIFSNSAIAQDYWQPLVIHKDMPNFEMKLVTVYEDEDETQPIKNYFQIVHKSTKKLFQKSADFRAGDNYGSFKIVDLNFDGYKDLKFSTSRHFIPKDDNPPISQPWHYGDYGYNHTWLFNPKTKKYEYNIPLSNVAELYADAEKQLLYVQDVTLYAHCQSSTTTYYYKFDDGKIIFVNSTYWHSNSNPNEPPVMDIDPVKEENGKD